MMLLNLHRYMQIVAYLGCRARVAVYAVNYQQLSSRTPIPNDHWMYAGAQFRGVKLRHRFDTGNKLRYIRNS